MDRVVVEKLIADMRAAEALALSLQNEAEACPWWRFVKKVMLLRRWRAANREWFETILACRRYRLAKGRSW